MPPTISSRSRFKATSIGSLPADWDTARIGDKFVLSGKTKEVSFKTGDIPFIPMSLLPSGRLYFSDFETRAWDAIASGTYFEDGDLLISKITPCFENGKQGIVTDVPGGYGFATTEVIPVRTIDGSGHLPFLAFYLLHPTVRGSLANKMEGATGRQRLSKNALADWVMPFPPAPEQRTIAKALSAVQATMRTQGEIAAKLRELKSATLEALIQGKPSLQWPSRRLEAICLKTRMTTPEREFRYVDVSAVSNEDFRITSTAAHTPASAPSRARKPILKDDVIMATVRPTLKRIALIPKELDGQICSTAFCVLRADREQVLPQYLYYAVQRPEFFEALGRIQHGASYPAVTDSDVRRQEIPLPPMDQQEKMAKTLSAIDRRTFTAKSKERELNRLFTSMLHELMTGKIRLTP